MKNKNLVSQFIFISAGDDSKLNQYSKEVRGNYDYIGSTL